MTTKLTMLDHHAMHQDGYCVTLGEEGYLLQRIPGSSKFKDDACAWLHVFDCSLSGEALATKVLSFLELHGYREFTCLSKYVSTYRPVQAAALRAA